VPDPISHLIDCIEIGFQRSGGLFLPRQTIENVTYAEAQEQRNNVLVARVAPSIPRRTISAHDPGGV